jgi:predicted GNAT superfamily acetyltransferase
MTSAEQAEAMSTFFKSVWGGTDDVVPFDLILALNHVGAYSFAAVQAKRIVGASFGVRGEYRGLNVLHSHVTASTVGGVGFLLKQHQRSWARERAISAITWTFDPLVRRNCYFNFVKLGAVAVEYLPNFYGTMTDDINRGDDSDRLMAFWPVSDADLPIACAADELVRQTEILLPADIETLRREDLPEAMKWRKTVRDVLQPVMSAGGIIRGMSPDRTRLIVTTK